MRGSGEDRNARLSSVTGAARGVGCGILGGLWTGACMSCLCRPWIRHVCIAGRCEERVGITSETWESDAHDSTAVTLNRTSNKNKNMLVLVTRLFRNSRVFAVALGPVMFPRRAGLLYPPGRRLRVSVPTHRLVKHSLGGYGDVLLVFSVRRVSTPPLPAASELMSQRALH